MNAGLSENTDLNEDHLTVMHELTESGTSFHDCSAKTSSTYAATEPGVFDRFMALAYRPHALTFEIAALRQSRLKQGTLAPHIEMWMPMPQRHNWQGPITEGLSHGPKKKDTIDGGNHGQ